MYSFDDLKKNKGTTTLMRKADIAQEYATNKEFHCNRLRNNLNDIFQRRNCVLLKNDFPYDVQNDIQHMVLWFNPNQRSDMIQQVQLNEVISALELHHEVVYWENKPEIRSVGDIKHYHVFLKKK